MKKKIIYPECEKLNEVANVHSTLNEFIEWLYDAGYYIKHYEKKASMDRNTVVYDFMKVDAINLEKERREMLNSISKKTK